MSLSFYSSPVKVKSDQKLWVKTVLNRFEEQSLAEFSKKQLKSASLLYKKISSSHSQIFIFAFGGMGASFRIGQSFFSVRGQKAVLIDSLDSSFGQKLSQLKRKELKSSHFVFISKTGQTSEILFYTKQIRKIYSKNRITLKGRLTVLTQSLKSPLLEWAEKELADIVFLEDTLPGRFSFFTFSGWFQLKACGLTVRPDSLKSLSLSPALDFLADSLRKKEIYLCFFTKELKTLSQWLEISWSESLFKTEMKKQAPVLRAVSFSDLRHGFIEELIAKQREVCFLGLDDRKNSFSNHSLRNLFHLKKIPYLIVNIEQEFLSFFQLIMFFYKLLFLFGEFSAVDIKTQYWVDYLKRTR